jgi:ribonuclease P/MRP protein subunit POP8
MSFSNTETVSSKRKAPDDRATPKTAPSQAIHFTSRNPPWTYLKLQLCVFPQLFLGT